MRAGWWQEAAGSALLLRCSFVVSIIAVVIATVLFIGELRHFLTVETAEFMEVDSIRGAKMVRISFERDLLASRLTSPFLAAHQL